MIQLPLQVFDTQFMICPIIKFYPSFTIQLNSVFHSDSTPTAQIQLTIPDSTHIFWFNLTHHFCFIFTHHFQFNLTQFSDLIQLPLHAFD